jgi:hypothetical protein
MQHLIGTQTKLKEMQITILKLALMAQKKHEMEVMLPPPQQPQPQHSSTHRLQVMQGALGAEAGVDAGSTSTVRCPCRTFFFLFALNV